MADAFFVGVVSGSFLFWFYERGELMVANRIKGITVEIGGEKYIL